MQKDALISGGCLKNPFSVERLSLQRTEEETPHQGMEATLLPEINRRVLAGEPLKRILQFICEQSVEIFDAGFVWIGQKERDGRIRMLGAAGSAGHYRDELERIGIRWDDDALAAGPGGQAIRTGRTVHTAVLDPDFEPWREQALAAGLHSVISVPITVGDRVLGCFSLYFRHGQDLIGSKTMLRIEQIGERICLAVERMLDRQRIHALSAALEKADDAVFITDPSGTIQWANEALAIQSGYALEELIGQSPTILQSGMHDGPYYDRLWQTILKGEMWTGETIERNVRGENYIVRQTITPILDEAGEIACFVAIHHDITERKQTEEKIRRLAHYDSLTGVPNRALFYDRLHQAISLGERHHRRFALLYLDLDGFKPVNDLYGHRCGDAVLRISAGRIAGQVRSSDTVARLGGDEFAILLHDVTEEHAAHRIAENVIEAVSAPMNAEGQQIEIAVSIGIAFFPHSGRDADALIHEADRAMYEAKRAGKKTIRTAAFQNR